MHALVYLGTRRFVNSLKRSVRNPRVLVPALLFLGIIFLVVLASFGAKAQGRDDIVAPFTPQEFVTGGPGALIAAIRSVLLVSLFTSVVTALGNGTIFFQPSDIDFLFPAPLSRRGILFFQMLGRYGRMILPAIYLPLAFGGATLTAMVQVSPLALWPGMLGMWLFFIATANIAQAALLARASKTETDDSKAAHRRVVVRRAIASFAVVLVFGLAWLAFRASLMSVRGPVSLGQTIRAVLRVINGEAVSVLLLPVAWASDLLLVAFAGWDTAAVLKLLGLFTLAGVSLLLLFSRERDFYEGALETTERRTRLVNAVQSGDAGTVLSQMARDGQLLPGRTVPVLGMGAWAILWKDLISLTRTPLRSWLTLLFIAAFPAALGVAVGGRRSELAVLLWLVLFTLNMANLFLLSVRDMVRRVDITKALPIAPARILMGELALSIAQLTLLGVFSLSLMALTGVVRGPMFGAALLILPTLAALLLFVQTCFVLLYPQRRDDVAQNAVAGFVSVGACIAALFPSLLIGISLFIVRAPLLIMGGGVTLANGIAAFITLQVAAHLWQRFDPTD
ncbi:MAG: putative ABC exporter domain-containing protein [Armatimonadota bacterium]